MRPGSSNVITCEENGSTSGTTPTCDRKKVNFEIVLKTKFEKVIMLMVITIIKIIIIIKN